MEKFSLPAQEKLTREVATRHGWEITKVYRDEGFSGSWIEKRPAFFALLQDAAKGRFDAVLVTDFDRLTRPDNLRDLGRIQEIFIQYDIKIVTLSDVIDLSNDDQWFLSSPLGIVGAKERKKLVARMKRGIQAKKEAGEFYGGITPSGYRRDDEGKLVLREIAETYAGKKGTLYTCYDWRTVRELFDLYLYQDVSLKAICKRHDMYFNTLVGIIDRAWFYAGYTVETRSRAERAKSGKKEPQRQLAPGRHPAIITSEEARRTLEKRKSVRVAHTRTRQKYPCVGLLRCGECGCQMYVTRTVKQLKQGPRRTIFYYSCKTRNGAQRWQARQKGFELQYCAMPWVRVDVVEEAAWRALETFLVSPEVVFDQVGNADHQIEVLETQLQEIELEKMELDRRRSRLLDLYERSEADVLEELDDRMDRIKKARETLDRRQLECQERVTYYKQQKVDPNQVYRVLSQIEEIIRFATPAHRKEVFRSLFCKMTVRRDKTLEVSAVLPTEDVAQRLTVTLNGDEEAGGYQLGAQKGAIVG